MSQEGRVRTRAGERLEGGERLRVVLPPPQPAELRPEPVELEVVYEDEHLVVVDKPAGMPVHPGPAHGGGTLVNALLARYPDLPGIGGVQRPGIVHRLDKDTSGLIIVARTQAAHAALSEQLKRREVQKTYLALLEGQLRPDEAMIEAPVGRDPNNRLRMMVRAEGGREAQTIYRVRARYRGYCLVEASPVTGRTHQLRVHFASLGHPVAGDPVYGHASALVSRQFLHSWRLRLRHPINGRELSLEAPLPPDLQSVLDRLAAE